MGKDINTSYTRIFIFGLTGVLLGIFFLHPAAMFVKQYQGANRQFNWKALQIAFSAKHLPMTIYFSLIGGCTAAIYASVTAFMISKLQKSQKEIQNQKIYIEQQINIARRVQLAFLPEDALITDEFDIKFFYQAASLLSGDFYGYFRNQNFIYFYIGDISGKGVSSALIMSAVSTLLNQKVSKSRMPSTAEVVNEINRSLVDMLPDDKYITMQLFKYDPVLRTGEYSNAGHPPPYLVRTDKGIIEKFDEVPSAPVGFGKKWKSNQNLFSLNKGEKLLLYTDGLTELRNPEGKIIDTFDFDNFLQSVATKSSSEILTGLERYRNMFASEKFHDDLTLLVFDQK